MWLLTYVLSVHLVDLQDPKVVVLVDLLEVVVVDAMTMWHHERQSRTRAVTADRYGAAGVWRWELVTENETCAVLDLSREPPLRELLYKPRKELFRELSGKSHFGSRVPGPRMYSGGLPAALAQRRATRFCSCAVPASAHHIGCQAEEHA